MTKGSASDGVVYHAGFPNAGEEQHLSGLSLDALVVKHQASTFFWRLENEVAGMNWPSGTLIVVDRALPLRKNGLAVMIVEEMFMLCRIKNGVFRAMDGKALERDVRFWGMVTYAVQEVR